MKRSKMFLMSVAVVLFAAGACRKDDDTTTPEVETVTPEVSVDGDVTVNAAGGTVTVEYSVTDAVEGASVSATTDADWVSAAAGDNAVTLTVAANETGADRSATVTLSYTNAEDVSFTVTQTVPVVSVTSSTVTVSATAGSTTVSYSVTNAVEGASVSATTSESWVSAVVGDGTVTLTVIANTVEEERSATVTLSYNYAQDVTVSVVQAPYASYSSFLGTWIVSDYYYTEGLITISAATEGSTYTVDGWQFGQTGLTFGDLGLYTDSDQTNLATENIAFTATYNNGVLTFSTAEFGTTYYMTNSGIAFTGTMWLLGTVMYNGSETNVTTSSGGSYDIATMSLTSATEAEITGGIIVTNSGNFDAIGMEYVYRISAPTSYSNYSIGWMADCFYFPCTLTKSSSTTSTSSVKSSEKVAAPMKSEMKSVQVAL